VDPVQPVRQDLTGQVLTDQFVPVQQGSEVILSSGAQEVNVSMTVSVLWTEHVLTTIADLLVRMHVVKMPSVKQGITVQSVLVLLGL